MKGNPWYKVLLKELIYKTCHSPIYRTEEYPTRRTSLFVLATVTLSTFSTPLQAGTLRVMSDASSPPQ
ncbi:hypothetical protein ILFOPFJJ_01790 [Ensifer psoraleae]|nr:hypothetical protein [Sinorhizobium psoraleae]